jgi:hypothetical protein
LRFEIWIFYKGQPGFLSLNNSRFGDYLHRIYPNELEVKDTTDIQKSASYLDIHLEIDNEGRTIKNKLYTNYKSASRKHNAYPLECQSFVKSPVHQTGQIYVL